LAKAKLFDALRWLIDLELLKDLIGLNDRFCHSIAYDESVCKGLETALPCTCLPGKKKQKQMHVPCCITACKDENKRSKTDLRKTKAVGSGYFYI
jgi:hypothetical protein